MTTPEPHAANPRPPARGLVAALGRPGIWWAGFAGWNAVLFWLSSLSGEELPPMPAFPQFDKVEHAGFFAAGAAAFTLARTLGRRGVSAAAADGAPRGWWRPLGLALAVVAVRGFLDEYQQIFTPHRSGLDPGDWAADVFGGLVGAWAALGSRRFFRRSEDQPPEPARAGETLP